MEVHLPQSAVLNVCRHQQEAANHPNMNCHYEDSKPQTACLLSTAACATIYLSAYCSFKMATNMTQDARNSVMGADEALGIRQPKLSFHEKSERINEILYQSMQQEPAAPTEQDDTLKLMNQIVLTCYSLDVSQYILTLAILLKGNVIMLISFYSKTFINFTYVP
jgi:hypothetical protein